LVFISQWGFSAFSSSKLEGQMAIARSNLEEGQMASPFWLSYRPCFSSSASINKDDALASCWFSYFLIGPELRQWTGLLFTDVPEDLNKDTEFPGFIPGQMV
jgi:hypothetical protein